MSIPFEDAPCSAFVFSLVAILALSLLVLAAGCLSWPATGPVTQPTTAPPATGSLDCSSSPEGSEIYLDRVYRGTTPAILPDVPAGTHTLEFRYHDYTPWTQSIGVSAGSRSYIHASLSPVTTQTDVAGTGPAGCWAWENFEGDSSELFTLVMDENGTGIWNESWERAGGSGLISNKVTWSYDPDTAVIAYVEAAPKDPDHPWEGSMNYDEKRDSIFTEGAEGKLFSMDRVACPVR